VLRWKILLSKFSKAIYGNLKYEDGHVFINLDRMESWLAPSMDLDIMTLPIVVELSVIVTCSIGHILR
jgi:hypothetical protein